MDIYWIKHHLETMLLSRISDLVILVVAFFSVQNIHTWGDTSLVLQMAPFSETNLIPAIPSIVYAKATNHIRPGLYHSKRNYLRYIFYILILRSSDTQLNPGPSPSEVTQHANLAFNQISKNKLTKTAY